MTASYVRRPRCPWLAVLTFGVVVLGGASTAIASPPYAGRPLADVLHELADAGLRIIYNNEIVPPSLRVTTEPTAQSGPELLQQLLKPHGLEARAMGGGVYAVAAATPAEVARRPPAPP